ncbi:LPS-assembly protein LptD [Oryzibacter oryziterrae]|uniref:LPS-assembly protein LptD n=1 Tax=Oryzibacter oryziterrae TaxID=2766474 RepID=UPI001F1E995F|nr:LPS-assembly protein LptD [Oryzibacter oryziterrae]
MRNFVVPDQYPKLRMRLLGAVAATAVLCLIAPASAQQASADTSLLGLLKAPEDPNAKMLVEADSVTYDMNQDVVTADGKVVIYYGAYVLLADQVAVNRKTKHVSAQGNVEITDPSGNVTRSDHIELTDDLKEGVAQALELVTADRIAFRARQATRKDGDETTFEDATYLPCVDCNGQKGREPIWKIRANRIIHRQKDKTIVMENATFDFLGVPIAWVPVLSQPDPSVKNKTGFLLPSFQYNTQQGFSVRAPYHIALAPDYSLTLSPSYYTKQGLLFDAEWRQKLVNGEYNVAVAGIHQNDPHAFSGTSGDREWRGSIETGGRFKINDRWNWGWDVAVASDATFMDKYDRKAGNSDVAVNQIYLTGVDGRNRLDLHGYGFFVQQDDSTVAGALPQNKDLQEKQPVVHPVLDYQVFAPEPVFGGEASITTNFASITRLKSDKYEFDVDGDGLHTPGAQTRLRGAAGTFDRASIDALWRRRFVDGIGETFTPFLYFKGDAIYSDPSDSSGLTQGNSTDLYARAMPAAGLEYSFPIGISSSFGHQVIEPVAQVIARPNETEAAYIPNEDAQSLVFDATSLFDYDKFSGFDRIEGGTRANVGFRYSGTFEHGISVNATAGQSFQLAGDNSFAMATAYDTGAYSGLENNVSDYVAGLSVNTNMGLMASTGVRVDPDNFQVNRFDAQLLGIGGSMTAAVTYAFIGAQPDLGITSDRSEVQGAVSLRLAENWRLFGASRYDLVNKDFVRHAVGIAYDSEEFSLSLSYSDDLTSSPADQTIYLRAGFRTLGNLSTSAGIGK